MNVVGQAEVQTTKQDAAVRAGPARTASAPTLGLDGRVDVGELKRIWPRFRR
jgi:hypothetical protein